MKYKELVQALTTLPEEQGKHVIMLYMSQDKNIIPSLIGMLEMERETKKELLRDMNLNLSRNLLGLIHNSGVKKEDVEQREFFIKETKEFYITNEEQVRCCFKIEGLK